jgi:hypothetical protein
MISLTESSSILSERKEILSLSKFLLPGSSGLDYSSMRSKSLDWRLDRCAIK